jgi:predicted small integral membrane protein
METALLLAQCVATAALAGWLATGVRDNILYPSLNETYTTEVFEIARMRDEYPEAFKEVAHRVIASRKLQLLAFRLVVLSELVTTLLLCVGTGALALALFGAVSAESARVLAMIGVTAFVGVWAAFLIVGNHFCYWFGHEGAQNTHFQLMLSGIGTLILLAQG